MKLLPEWIIVGMIFGFAFIIALILAGCAPQGYIEGQSACQIEVDRLKDENNDLRDKYVKYNPEESTEEDAGEEYP